MARGHPAISKEPGVPGSELAMGPSRKFLRREWPSLPPPSPLGQLLAFEDASRLWELYPALRLVRIHPITLILILHAAATLPNPTSLSSPPLATYAATLFGLSVPPLCFAMTWHPYRSFLSRADDPASRLACYAMGNGPPPILARASWIPSAYWSTKLGSSSRPASPMPCLAILFLFPPVSSVVAFLREQQPLPMLSRPSWMLLFDWPTLVCPPDPRIPLSERFLPLLEIIYTFRSILLYRISSGAAALPHSPTCSKDVALRLVDASPAPPIPSAPFGKSLPFSLVPCLIALCGEQQSFPNPSGALMTSKYHWSMPLPHPVPSFRPAWQPSSPFDLFLSYRALLGETTSLSHPSRSCIVIGRRRSLCLSTVRVISTASLSHRNGNEDLCSRETCAGDPFGFDNASPTLPLILVESRSSRIRLSSGRFRGVVFLPHVALFV
ncbi:hypothetical protein BJ322DRAFT_1020898 [Thelephora terrestris]|uniref:Uncharacterized protein n=1 Tax=Thelephora terrestris TaxID=56493 RepID=A0A9P6HEQ1_9AGAM|nr:hypothetical protein BJ322DRAFT_1020898 [Thelephora terrestris]